MIDASRALAPGILAGVLLATELPGRTDDGPDYDIVYVRAPRAGDDSIVPLPEVFHPIQIGAGTDLMLLHPDGSEEVLVAGGAGAIVDPFVSFDAQWVYYSKFHDQTDLDRQRPGNPARAGADVFKIHLATREIVRLTFQEWTPNTGVLEWSSDPLAAEPDRPHYLGYGVFNLGPCPLPGGKVVFSSSRNNYFPNKSFTHPNFQLFVMDNDGGNVECIGHLNLGSALHPTVLADGRVMFSSYEAQGLRDRRLWGLWAIWPDGTRWEPLFSAFTRQNAFHFQTQLSDGRIAVADYYNKNNNGFGTVLAFPADRDPSVPAFGSPAAGGPGNPAVRRGIWWFSDGHPSHRQPRYRNYAFSPPGLEALSAFSHSDDNASSRNLAGDWAGKVTHPAGAPGNDVLVTYSPGPANSLNRPTTLPAYDAGLALIPGGVPVTSEADMHFIRNDPAWNEMQPRPVVPYSAIYGVEEPASLPWLSNDGGQHPALEPGTPFGLVGSSSFYRRDTDPAVSASGFDGFDAFNSNQNQADSNWSWQGAAAGKYEDADIHAVRILSMEPSSNVGRGPGIGNNGIKGFSNHANERLRILGEIPLRKWEGGAPVLDPDGNPDTSFLARIPADTPFTFQTLDKDGLVLNMSQTWHQVRPGEMRADCGGCHAHSQLPLDFGETAAARANYTIPDLALKTPLLSKDRAGETVVVETLERYLDVEYHRDIEPILQRSCIGCHSDTTPGGPAAMLRLDDTSVVDGYDNTWNRLARDGAAEHGIPPVISTGSWRNHNASRYIRKFQSRRSLLAWKVFGRRLDGWTNDDHPTEAVPGDPSTLPAGASPNQADIDYTGTIMPPPASGYPPLSEDEKITIARWIDLGAPITSQSPGVLADLGWFADELRPVISVALPQAGRGAAPLERIRLGLFDYYSGLDPSSLSVKASFELDGYPPQAELASLFTESGDHVWSHELETPIDALPWAELTVSVEDHSGNRHVVVRRFAIGEPGPPRVDSVWLDEGRFGLRLTGEPQGRWVVERSPDALDWNPFVTLLDFDGAQTITDPVEAPTMLYRVSPE